MAWIALCVALGLHVLDEASTHFLSVYNPTVVAIRRKLGFWPMPTFEFRDWLVGLIIGILVLSALSPFAFRNTRWMRPIFYFVAIVAGLLNALGHTTATIFGHTVSSVRFAPPAPGFYSSPLLADCYSRIVGNAQWKGTGTASKRCADGARRRRNSVRKERDDLSRGD
jgi:hypothetical protein